MTITTHQLRIGSDAAGPAPVPAQVAAADEALFVGTLEPLRGLVEPRCWASLQRRFDRALALRGSHAGDPRAIHASLRAYVSFLEAAGACAA